MSLCNMSRRDAFFICFGAFIVQVGVFGVHNNFGSIFHSLKSELNADVSQLAWIGSFGMGTTFLVSPLSCFIYHRFGFERLIGLSILLCITSWLTSSFVRRLELLSFTYSILWGTGSGFAHFAATILIQLSFTKRLSIANGIALSGTGFGALVLGQIITWLLNNFGYEWTFRACAVIPLSFTFLLYSYRCTQKSKIDVNGNLIPDNPVSNPSFEPSPDVRKLPTKKSFKLRELIDIELWRNTKYVIFVIGCAVFMFGSHIPFVFLISHAINAQISPTNAQFLISILSIVSTLSKVLSGIFLSCQKCTSRNTLFFCSMICLALSNLIVAKATHYWQFCVYSVIYGTFEGCFVGQLPTVVVDMISSKEKFAVAIGNLFALISIPMTLGPVFAGALVKNDSYTIPFYAATSVSFLGALLTSASKFCDNKSKEKEKEPCDRELLKKDGLNIGNSQSFSICSV